jgi:hypothetical protein
MARTETGLKRVAPSSGTDQASWLISAGRAERTAGRGVRPQVALIADHARMLAALDREQDRESLRRVRRIVEFDRGTGRLDHGLESRLTLALHERPRTSVILEVSICFNFHRGAEG